MNRSVPSLAVALLILSLGCRPEAITGSTPPDPAVPPVTSVALLAVELSGQPKIQREGTYFYQARPSGGSGKYEFRWDVSSGPVATAVRTGIPDAVTYAIPDGYYMLRVRRGDGDLVVRVTVTAGDEQATSAIYVRNCIGGCTAQP